MLWVAAMSGFAFAQGVDLLDLSQPEESFWKLDLGTLIQLAIAAAAWLTFVVAWRASVAWRAQLTAQPGLDIARRLSLQVAMCQEVTPYLYHSSIELMEMADDLVREPKKWQHTIDEDAQYIRNAEEVMEKLRSLELEYRAYWNTEDTTWLEPVYNLLGWSIGCNMDAADALSEALAAGSQKRLGTGWVEYRKDQSQDWGIALNKHDTIAFTRQFFAPTRVMIERLTHLKG